MRAISVFALLACQCAFAQRYNFKFYGEEEGLENLAVQVLLQDRAGFLWAGTQNGLYRYDGAHFAAFGKSDGLPAARIEALHESVDGTLWAGTQNGIARRRGDSFEAVPLGVARGVLGREAIASDAAGTLYLATERGLAIGSIFPGHPFRLIACPDGAASVYVDSNAAVWFGCGRKLCRLDQGQAVVQDDIPPERWDAILGDIEGNLWIRSEKSLYVRAPGSNRFQPRRGPPEATNTYPTLAIDPAGKLLVPTYRGLARQTDTGWEIIDAGQGLTTNDIAAVVEDREGAVWLGLLGSGLARWLGYNEWQNWSQQDGLSRESIWSIARGASHRLWVGTQFGLNYAENHDGSLVWRKQPIGSRGRPVQMIRALAPAPDGTLWVGASPGGLLRLNPRTGETQSFGAADGLNSDNVRHILLDRLGRLWVSTRDGLFLREAGARTFTTALAGETFYMTLLDRSGALWAAGAHGLARFSDGQWKRFTTANGLKSDVVAHLAEDPDGSLWISYYDAFGLTRLRFPRGRLTLDHFSAASGLGSDKSLFLGFDARGWLWAGSDHGADAFDRVRWRHYGRSDGLIWDDCNTNAFMADPDGGVWIGTSRGLSRFLPAANRPASVPPPVVFTSVKFGDQNADPANIGEIPYRRNSLDVKFAALTFVQESRVLFRYRLGQKWIETTQRELTFPQLPSGQYTLEVMARNAQGDWSAQPVRLSFQILPPWWLSWWFRIGAVLFVLALGQLMWQRRTHRLQVERFRLETAVAERTRELLQEKHRVIEEKARAEQQKLEIERLLQEAQQASRSKSEFLANMSHEIRTPMNGVIGMTDMVLASPLTPEQRDYLETARLSATSLLTILNDVLDFSKIEAGRMELSPIEFSLRQSVQETSKIFSVAIAEKNLRLELRFDEALPDRVVGDPDRLRQVLLNLIGNAIKFTFAGGVTVNVERASRSADQVLARFEVRDSGIGIPRDKQQIIFEAFRQADGSTTRKYGGTGLGLSISSRLVEMMGGSLAVESEPGRGSTFHFTIRLGLPAKMQSAAPIDPASLQNMFTAVNTAATPPSLYVLLAEDNPVNQRVAMRLLEKRGHRVALATTGQEALEWVDRARFDLILMDVQMPDMDGIEATLQIRQREKQTGGYTPILALTAHTMPGDRDRCLEAGMNGYIHKPIEAAEFLELAEAAAAGLVTPHASDEASTALRRPPIHGKLLA
ncbi:MAG TPA: two-component regulator propeller domain-containing protein [Bryobacteraceae bacterium]|nr:two-component regulator propeller domain-containing protein [Bryobacteraceae bacterium]